MDQLYTISKQNEINISRSLVSRYDEKLTPVIIDTNIHSNQLTKQILNHFEKIKSLTFQDFNWQYYMSRYDDIDRHYNKETTWKHWCTVGKTQNRNPINRCSIKSPNELPLMIVMMYILLDAINKQYETIIIINLTFHVTYIIDFDLLSKYFNEKEGCIFSCDSSNCGYMLKRSTFETLLTELSFFIHDFDTLLNTYNISYQIIDYSITKCQDVDVYVIDDTLKIEKDCLPILNFREQYLIQQYDRFKEMNHLMETERNRLDYMLDKYPYDFIKMMWNQELDLNIDNYMYLCSHIHQFDYFTKLKIQQPSTISHMCDTIYFSREYYLRIYPCYKGKFKNYNESFSHFINHGIGEKLIPNQAIFNLTQRCQEYLLNNMLSNIRIDSLPSKLESEPVIYILTRTCDREKLFHNCVNSVLSQKYKNLRHIVSYDNQITYNYVKTYQHIYELIDLTSKKSKLHPNHYIDCLYDSLTNKEPGWVMVMDDDDKFMTSNAICYLKHYLTDPDIMVIWMLYRPDKFIYPVSKSCPCIGEIGSCCYLYHTSTIKKGFWGGTGIGDFTFFRHIFNKVPNHIYVDIPFTGVNYEDQISGWTAM